MLEMSSRDIGDEPLQLFNKFKNITVGIDADRQNGLKRLKAHNPLLEVVLLDDAFQHRKVTAGFNILLTAYDHLYCDDIVLPTGNLREPRAGAKRAQVIVVTKCPDQGSICCENFNLGIPILMFTCNCGRCSIISTNIFPSSYTIFCKRTHANTSDTNKIDVMYGF